MDLFSEKTGFNEPLAARMRPRTLEEFVGQEQILGPGKLLRRSIEADRLGSLLFYGPPGTGKTTLAHIIARTTDSEFQQLNAVMAGVKDIRAITAQAEENLKFYQKKTILFIDEIHRFNKSQQDALLPTVEKGIVTMIGATTENPYFEVNAPLLSRSRIFRLEMLTEEDIITILKRACEDEERGLGRHKPEVTEEALRHLARVSAGDARSAINALELAFMTTEIKDGRVHIDLAIAEESIQEKAVGYDKDGDNHYDTISAFIKSLRGSDPNAALYWLAKMIYAGEDPKFICRRLLVHASEDVGMADPQALVVAVATAQALERLGMPEGRFALAQATVYIATAPKSNAIYRGIDEAMEFFKQGKNYDVPIHLRDTSYKGASRLGHGKGYKYPHDFPNGFCVQEYLPADIAGQEFYRPTGRGFEKEINKRLQWFNEKKKQG